MEQVHVTRMVPTRRQDLLDGGSLYWVIKGEVAARQRLMDLRPFVDGDGIRRCAIVLDPEIVRVAPTPKRAFQGWRYLDPKSAPPDLGTARAGEKEMPSELSAALAAIGVR